MQYPYFKFRIRKIIIFKLKNNFHNFVNLQIFVDFYNYSYIVYTL